VATRAERIALPTPNDDRFFMGAALAMALVVVAGFSTQLAAGRSSFASPPLVHAHAIVFMGWVAIYLAQNYLAVIGNRSWHRRLGWVAAGWIIAMLALGTMVTVAMARRGQVPFFFRPQHFLVADPLTLVGFAALTIAAIANRRRTDWHRRLHFCAMVMLLGPAFGRLLPMPLLSPLAFETAMAATLLFPLAGVVADRRRCGRVHPAWGWGIGAIVGTMLLIDAIAYSPVGAAVYMGITAGSPGAAVDPLAFPPPPAGGRITGRASPG
jgi:hypothetical protein